MYRTVLHYPMYCSTSYHTCDQLSHVMAVTTDVTSNRQPSNRRRLLSVTFGFLGNRAQSCVLSRMHTSDQGGSLWITIYQGLGVLTGPPSHFNTPTRAGHQVCVPLCEHVLCLLTCHARLSSCFECLHLLVLTSVSMPMLARQ
jgi:hypothetical protein